ncbi:stage III sporulation protein AG [Fictibacillus aquaticus]|uniref:Stage III sporulation protein AG n=1 Tax=Fictibacillus aquaticus TaxID=2021314 RepID=A0A235F945_9BACL|nr:stage III sporulation protein AG [Fictibacillus aquaticus]OYD57798.1 stage III sporulation protein AG [Fictibacillus aquaticus]
MADGKKANHTHRGRRGIAIKHKPHSLSRLADLLKGGKLKGSKQKYMLLLFVLGVVLLAGNKMLSPPKVPSQTAMAEGEVQNSQPVFKQAKKLTPKNIQEFENRYKEDLKEILEQIRGVGSVSVMVELDTSETRHFITDEGIQEQTTVEKDPKGGERTISDKKTDSKTVIIRNGSNEEPIIVTTEKPRVRGVIVVAEGAGSLKTKAVIIDAVTKVFDIGSNRVSVLPKNAKGE